MTNPFRSRISALFAAISQPAPTSVEVELPPTVRPAEYVALEREVYVSLEGEETTMPIVCQSFEQYCAYLGVNPQEALRAH